MRTLKILIGLVAALVLSTATGAVSAHRPEGMQPPPPMSHPMGPSAISADKQHLYVVVDGKIMQFGASDMKLVKTVDLPKPALPSDTRPADAPPSDAPHQGKPPGHCPPFGPPMAGPLGIYATESFLYVVAGPVIHQFSTPDLKLRNTVELPRPEPPQAGN